MMLKWRRIRTGRYFAAGAANGYVIKQLPAAPEHGIKDPFWVLEVSQNEADDCFYLCRDAKAAAQAYEDAGEDVPAPWFVPSGSRMAH